MTGTDRGLRDSAPVTGSRAAARLHVFRLVQDIQAGLPLTARDVRRILDEADRRGWPEVARAALFLDAVRSSVEGGRLDSRAVGTLLDRAVADDDLVMTALALGLGAQATTGSERRAPVASDLDLARAAVMLESPVPPSLELGFAHVVCAIAYGERNLWELELEHYHAAESALPDSEEAMLLLPAIRFDQTEAQVNWLMALRELGDEDELPRQSALAVRALHDADTPMLPDAWRRSLRIFALMIAAIAPTVADPRWMTYDPLADGRFEGFVHLARALLAPEQRAALERARKAVSCTDPGVHPHAYNLALRVQAELEESLAGRDGAALAYGRHLARLRWQMRASSLASAQSMRQAESLRSEHSLLSQHAYLDDLTQLGNRRSLARHLDGLVAQAVHMIAIVLVDIDSFKDVNDRHGHAIGDLALARVADVLRGAVRGGDLAVRLGGDEFLLIMAGMQLEVARERAEAIRAQVAAEPWEERCPGLRLTVSVGIAAGEPRAHEQVKAAADRALYRSKRAGGNAVNVAAHRL
ncbi:MAG: diguanylate cyclase [Solirubrobacteraceae bacterium]